MKGIRIVEEPCQACDGKGVLPRQTLKSSLLRDAIGDWANDGGA
jgi:hypothetical protein